MMFYPKNKYSYVYGVFVSIRVYMLWCLFDDFIRDSTLKLNELTHCGLLTPYGDRDLGQNWLSNGLLPDGTKPLPEPMLTHFQCVSVAFI